MAPKPPISAKDPILLPVQLEAFILNPKVCGEPDDHGARIAPITQPNYTFLRLDNFTIQSDVQPHIDMHNTAPAEINTRLTDLGAQPQPAPRRNRHGVYLHWILPRMYRAGVASTGSVTSDRDKEEREKKGLPPQPDKSDPKADTATPDFVEVPTRWLVIRKIDRESIRPVEAKDKFEEYEAWVVESNYRWRLDDIPQDYDLQVDVSPFVFSTAEESIDQNHINQQAEVFIGRRWRAKDWSETELEGKKNEKHVSLSLLRSSNQLFADFQLHNSNVFSILDNFQYGDPKTKVKTYLDAANANYYVVGWHSKDNTDPFLIKDSKYTHQQRLEALFLKRTQPSNTDFATEWLESTEPIPTICHGAMYDVKWDRSKKPTNVPADEFASRLQNREVPALAVGTTPMDSIISYITARKSAGQQVEDLEESILHIESLLHARDEGVEGQREAMDTVYNWNFECAPGGSHFYVSGEDSTGQQTRPSKATQEAVQQLNILQDQLDAAERAAAQYRWDMFSCWWKYVSSVQMSDYDNDGWYEKETKNIEKRIDRCTEKIKKLSSSIDKALEAPVPVDNPDASQVPLLKELAKKSATLPFYRAKDPTVLVGGIESGWATDFLENVPIRLPAETVAPSESLAEGLKTLISVLSPKVPPGVGLAINALLPEFQALTPKAAGESATGQALKEHEQYPVFHDQPWFPLFVEWEVEYTHIPFEHWSLDEHTARASVNKMIRYGIHTQATGDTKEFDPLSKVLKNRDVQILSGRSLILPQPSFSLATKVQQLFSDTPPKILEKYLDETKRNALLRDIKKLAYLSSPLSGLTGNLVTLFQGSHIKPENRVFDPTKPISTPVPTDAAIFNDAGFTKTRVGKIQGESGLTPFGGAVMFPSKDFCPFKPATHGQFRFRKFNIIDKFGQALVAINPKPLPKGLWPPIYPCISDFYEPQLVRGDSRKADTVVADDVDHCEFMQLPPQINQISRLNSVFVVPETDPKIKEYAYWQPASEWDNPVWGWLVVNYADYGLQLFLPNGTFYREVRIGGPKGILTEPTWVPFAPGEADRRTDTAQLDALIQKLQDQGYTKAFWDMVVRAVDSLQPAPNSYAEYLNSLVGKPLALVNAGWSLELAGPEYQNQATRSAKKDPSRWLLEGEHRTIYDFQIKLGDKERAYDGLVAYFDSHPNKDLIKPDRPKTELLLDKIHTYFYPKLSDPSKVPAPLVPIAAPKYPNFKAFYNPPVNPDPTSETDVSNEIYTGLRNRRLTVFGFLMDPFTPVHAYSSFLPPSALQLPSWTWQEAMKRMMAFFHMGPLTLIDDVPDYNPARKLTTEGAEKLATDQPPTEIPLPGLTSQDWCWLQPYLEGTNDQDPPAYNAIALQEGPYTAIEGFLLLRRPLLGVRKEAAEVGLWDGGRMGG
ncbi:hypothetical protein BDD12DRAFT_854690 [Trichophaea hybrida]|nr:hypothetical protein BDD12DRAFT_854690 [Trichophaea hybrida]